MGCINRDLMNRNKTIALTKIPIQMLLIIILIVVVIIIIIIIKRKIIIDLSWYKFYNKYLWNLYYFR